MNELARLSLLKTMGIVMNVILFVAPRYKLFISQNFFAIGLVKSGVNGPLTLSFCSDKFS